MPYWTMTQYSFWCYPNYGMLVARICAAEVQCTRSDVVRECGLDAVERTEADVARNRSFRYIDRWS